MDHVYICSICGCLVSNTHAEQHGVFHTVIKDSDINSHPPIDLEPAIRDILSNMLDDLFVTTEGEVGMR